MVLVGVAQEKANVFGAPTKKQRQRGRFAATRRSAYVKHYYFYIWDRDFGPTFIKFCSYAPFSVRVCLNGHMWLRQHLQRSNHVVEPLDTAWPSSTTPAPCAGSAGASAPAPAAGLFEALVMPHRRAAKSTEVSPTRKTNHAFPGPTALRSRGSSARRSG